MLVTINLFGLKYLLYEINEDVFLFFATYYQYHNLLCHNGDRIIQKYRQTTNAF